VPVNSQLGKSQMKNTSETPRKVFKGYKFIKEYTDRTGSQAKTAYLQSAVHLLRTEINEQ
jgi:hypothetical protein